MKNIAIACLLFAAFSNPANSAEISKQDWLSGMRTALPKHFCKENTYFRQCFEVSKSECLDVAREKTIRCLDEVKEQIPDILQQPRDGSKWGYVVGGCAGRDYEIKLKSVRISSARCNNIENWR